MMMLDPFRKLYRDVGERMEDHLEVTLVDPSYRVYYRDGSRIDATPNMARMLREIEELAGEKEAAKYPQFLGELGEFAALAADERDGGEAVVHRPIDGFDEIRRAAADTECHHDVTGPGEILELLLEDVFVGVIVTESGDPADIVVQGQAAEAGAELVGGAFAKVGDKMRRIGGATAIAENENLPVFAKGLPEKLDQFGHRVNTDT